jgi:hypothetical protein
MYMKSMLSLPEDEHFIKIYDELKTGLTQEAQAEGYELGEYEVKDLEEIKDYQGCYSLTKADDSLEFRQAIKFGDSDYRTTLLSELAPFFMDALRRYTESLPANPAAFHYKHKNLWKEEGRIMEGMIDTGKLYEMNEFMKEDITARILEFYDIEMDDPKLAFEKLEDTKKQ